MPIPPEVLSRRARSVGKQPISDLMARALANPDLISLAAGFVDPATLPVEATRHAVEALLADPRAARVALQYGTTAGSLPLRQRVLEQFLAADGTSPAEANVDIDQVVMTAGSNELLHLLCDTLLDPGDIVLCTAPSYLVFLGTLANLGARSVGVGMDAGGLIPEALDEAFDRHRRAGELDRIKAVYVVSYFDNPTNVTLAAERRPKIVEICQRWSRPGKRIRLLEDCAYRELRYSGPDVPSLRAYDPDGNTVVVTQTFSKSFSPGLRVGYGILPRDLAGPVCAQKGNIDFGAPHFSQCVLARVLAGGEFDTHVARLRAGYREKLHAMLAALDKHLAGVPGVSYSRPSGGLYVWLVLPEEIDTGLEGPLFDAAVREGTLYVPGEFCYPAEGLPAARNTVRLSFGVETPEGIARGVEALGRAVRNVAQTV